MLVWEESDSVNLYIAHLYIKEYSHLYSTPTNTHL